MPYLLLALGIIFGVAGAYRYFISANPRQIKAFFLAALLVILSLALIIMALSGRFATAVGIVVSAIPFILAWHNERKKPKLAPVEEKRMSRKEALEILNISGNVSDEDVMSAYRKLMKKVHPDQDGSKWMAEKLNEARDTLLK